MPKKVLALKMDKRFQSRGIMSFPLDVLATFTPSYTEALIAKDTWEMISFSTSVVFLLSTLQTKKNWPHFSAVHRKDM